MYVIPNSDKDIQVSTRRISNFLDALQRETDKIKAIDLILEQTPDGKIAINTWLRLTNQGIDVEFRDKETGERVTEYDNEWRDFCANMGGNTSSGLDGLLDQLHYSEFAHGGMAVEVVVGKGASEIEAVIVIDPKVITEFTWLEKEGRYAAYQEGQSGAKVDLYEGNFFWIPHQPRPASPVGTLQFEPAIEAMQQYYQFLKDSALALNRVVIPKYDVSIDMEKLLSTATPEVLNDKDKLADFLNSNIETIRSQMSSVVSDSNFLHYNNTAVDIIGGGINANGLDIRAWEEMHEPLVVNSFCLTPVLMGRLKSGSYSLGTAEYKMVKDNAEVARRNSKRMIENIGNLWARVNGLNLYCKATHRPVEWEILTEKYEAEIKRIEKARRAEEYGYTDHNNASAIALGKEANPQETNGNLFEYIKKQFAVGKQVEEEETDE